MMMMMMMMNVAREFLHAHMTFEEYFLQLSGSYVTASRI
jgi:hypothetical protein